MNLNRQQDDQMDRCCKVYGNGTVLMNVWYNPESFVSIHNHFTKKASRYVEKYYKSN